MVLYNVSEVYWCFRGTCIGGYLVHISVRTLAIVAELDITWLGCDCPFPDSFKIVIHHSAHRLMLCGLNTDSALKQATKSGLANLWVTATLGGRELLLMMEHRTCTFRYANVFIQCATVLWTYWNFDVALSLSCGDKYKKFCMKIIYIQIVYEILFIIELYGQQQWKYFEAMSDRYLILGFYIGNNLCRKENYRDYNDNGNL